MTDIVTSIDDFVITGLVEAAEILGVNVSDKMRYVTETSNPIAAIQIYALNGSPLAYVAVTVSKSLREGQPQNKLMPLMGHNPEFFFRLMELNRRNPILVGEEEALELEQQPEHDKKPTFRETADMITLTLSNSSWYNALFSDFSPGDLEFRAAAYYGHAATVAERNKTEYSRTLKKLAMEYEPYLRVSQLFAHTHLNQAFGKDDEVRAQQLQERNYLRLLADYERELDIHERILGLGEIAEPVSERLTELKRRLQRMNPDFKP